MVDSTNPRIIADNIKELTDKQIAQAAELVALGSYSATEVNTGMKYDEFDIFRKIFEINDPVVGELTTVVHGVTNLGMVFDCHGVAQVAPGFSGKNIPYSSNILLTFSGNNIEYSITAGQSAIKKLIIVFEYTKSASALMSPSPETRTLEEPEPEPIEEKK